MTAYGRKYSTNYKRFSNSKTTIDILQKNYSGSVTELMPGGDPLTIEWNCNVTNLYNPSDGSGATIRVFDKNNATAGGTVRWHVEGF